MNGSFFSSPTFPQATNPSSPPGNISSEQQFFPLEQSLIENILRLNRGKKIKAYVSYPDSNQWKDKIYTGIIKEAGKDHLIIEDTSNNTWYLIRMIYFNYAEFEEPINYNQDYSDTFD